MSARPRRRSRSGRRPGLHVGCVVLVLALLAGVAGAGWWVFENRTRITTPSFLAQCRATASDSSVTVTHEQAHYAAIIAGVSAQRGMVPRAATIALATAYQESGIRNLDYGDRDSVGLFQQRPSQDWGTAEQIMDPYYATHAFYDVLVTIPNWESSDINDTAQAVQRSGYPEAYRQHEGNARILASVLTGQSPAAMSCTVSEPGGGNPAAMAESLTLALGELPTSEVEGELHVAAADAQAWAVAHHAVANADQLGVRQVRVGDQSWTAAPDLSDWVPADPVDGVIISF